MAIDQNKEALRDYQVEAIDHVIKQHKVILGDEQGLGKTRVCLEVAIKLCQDKPRVLVFAPSTALGTWKSQARKWIDADAIIYSGNTIPEAREALWKDYLVEKPMFLVATYAMMDEILSKQLNWPMIIADEYHKAGLMNHKTVTYKNLKRAYSSVLMLVSGTPAKKGPQDLFAPLHLINPHKFNSYWRYVHTHCIVTKGPFGTSIEGRPAKPTEFKEVIKPYLIRRTKKQVLKELPPIQRQAIYVDLSTKQEKYYAELAGTGTLETPNRLILCPNEVTKLLRLRQLLVSPRIFGLDDDGGAIQAMRQLVQDSYDSGRPVTIVTPFRPAVDIIAEALPKTTEEVYKIMGGMKESAFDVATAFQQSRRIRRALIFTITSGVAFDAYASNTCIFVGAEWVASENGQAEARVHRLGQRDSVNAYYLLYPDTIDDAILDRLDERQRAMNWVLRTDEMIKLLQRQRRSRLS